MARTRVKICGLMNQEDALAAVEAGADALGFVFADSPRRVDPETVAEIVRLLPPLVTTVGVFANAALDELHQTMRQARLMVAQLHGQENAEYVRAVSYPVIKRIQVAIDDEPLDVRERMDRFGMLDFLFDPGGGSGVRMNLDLIPIRPGDFQRAYLAGGLNASNVGNAIIQVRPFAVDVSSGVESAVGKKDRAKMRALIEAVQAADLPFPPA